MWVWEKCFQLWSWLGAEVVPHSLICFGQTGLRIRVNTPQGGGVVWIGGRVNVFHFLLQFLIIKCADLLEPEAACVLSPNEWDVQVHHHSHGPRGKALSAATSSSEELAEELTFCVRL